jgi:hypothetical protein
VEQAPSEPERSPEERFPEVLPEVINCREPEPEEEDDDLHQPQGRMQEGRMQDLEKSLDERIDTWEKQQQVVEELRSSEAAELRQEMTRLKESSIEEISKLRSEVERLQQARKQSMEAEAERTQQTQQRVGRAFYPKSTKYPSSSSHPPPVVVEHTPASAKRVVEHTPAPAQHEASEVARLQAELELREESALVARLQIAQLQQEVDELRLLKKSVYAKDVLSGC